MRIEIYSNAQKLDGLRVFQRQIHALNDDFVPCKLYFYGVYNFINTNLEHYTNAKHSFKTQERV